jgi:hypothetical protein
MPRCPLSSLHFTIATQCSAVKFGRFRIVWPFRDRQSAICPRGSSEGGAVFRRVPSAFCGSRARAPGSFLSEIPGPVECGEGAASSADAPPMGGLEAGSR